MDELSGLKNRFFQNCVESGSGYLLMPIGIKNTTKPIEENNLIIDFDYSIKMKKAIFKVGADIKDNDICKVVLNPADHYKNTQAAYFAASGFGM